MLFPVMKTTNNTPAPQSTQADDGKRYTVFVRDWWREWFPGCGEGRPANGLIPYGGAPKETLAEGLTWAEARELCEEYNSTHEPGRYSRKAEFCAE